MKNKTKVIFVIISLITIIGVTVFNEKNTKNSNMNYSYGIEYNENADIDISENVTEETD